jgi:hypothetical protein
MSYEHVWGKWLRPYVRVHTPRHEFRHEFIGRPDEPMITKGSIRAGDLFRSKVRVVCTRCNNGWLSEIQEAAKLILIPLIQGAVTTLGIEAQRSVATWCAMATMTGEFLDRDISEQSVAISQAEREWLWKNSSPPKQNWRVWIARYQRYRWVSQWFHFTVPILEAEEIPKPGDPDYRSPNTQTTTFVIGELYVHVMSTFGRSEIVDRWVWPIGSRPATLLAQIWPRRESVITWPTDSLTNGDADFIASAFGRVIDVASRGVLGRRIF